MKYKKIMFMLVLAIFIFGAASVCASDMNDTVIASEDTGQTELSAGNENEIVEQASNEEVISEANAGTFQELQQNITQGYGSYITLDKDYEYEDGFSTDGITITQSIIIDGQGHKIDAKGKARIFNIKTDNVILQNITFMNGKSTDGGAIKWEANRGSVLNCHFENNTATGDGGAIHWFNRVESPNVNFNVIRGCSFVNNTANYNYGGGGAVYFDGEKYTATVEDCNFKDNSAPNGGAVYFLEGYDAATVSNCNFTDNKATGDYSYGGAVYFLDQGTVTNCNFTGNNATGEGGAVYFFNTGSVSDCNFTDNTATYYGGAIYFLDQGTVTNCNFTNNKATGDYARGGAIFFVNTATVEDCNFTDNSARNGGAIRFSGSGTVTNCNFTNNKATGTGNYDGGGAVYFYSTGNVTNCNFTDNDAYYGGAVYFYGEGNVTNCNFTDNNATGDGGAIYFENSGNVTNCNFTDNSATVNGGAIRFSGSGNVTNCNFTGNTATGEGGAVYFFNTGSVSDCNFTGNTASRDGGAVYFSSNGDVTNCNFAGNNATGDYSYGGAVRIYFGSVSNCNFTNNSAVNGGAINMDDGTVSNCNFTNNSATNEGGAIYILSCTVSNCNFTNNTADCGGAVYFNSDGTVTNCTFTNNSAIGDDGWGGAVFFIDDGDVSNCTFTNNSGYDGAVSMFSGSVENCNFTGNKATGDDGCGGAVHFLYVGDVSNCNFTDNYAVEGGAISMTFGTVTNCNFTGNKANYGGAVCLDQEGVVSYCNFTDNYAVEGGAINMGSGTVSYCNFTGNNATTGSAIHFWDTRVTNTVSNSIFLNNRANAEALEIIKNDNNITFTFTGRNYLLNAIYSTGDVNFTNVTYWGANGITTISATISGSNKAAGQNITVGVVVNDKLVLNDVIITNENGTIVLDIIAGENYYISARHDTDSYYTEAETTISNNTKFNVNVTSKTTTNKTVNITAKSNIYSEVMPGKLLFILPNGTQIEATYGDNGTWWAEHTFDDYSEYKVNATYVGLDNVTINNGTITINKVNSTITLDNIVLDYGETKNVTVTTTGATGITAKIDGNNVTVINNYTIQIPVLDAGTYNLTVTTITDDDHNPVTKEVNITVNKVNSTLTVSDIIFDYSSSGSTVVSLTGANGVNATVVGQPKAVVKVNGTNITVSDLDAGTYTLTVTAIGDKNHNNVTKNATITVNKLKTELTGNAITTTYNVNKDLVITLKDITGKALSGVKVTVDLNGAKTYTTDKNGQVKVTTKGIAPKAYTAKVTFNGNTTYDKSTKDIKVTVKKATPKLTAKKKTYKTTTKTKKYTIVLKDNTGKAIKKAKVTLKVKGKTYKATTNSKGKATFKITKLNKKGTFKATITYKGNKYYNKISKKANIKVIVTFKTVSKGSKDKSTVKEIQQALKDKGYYLTYQGHYLKVDGKFSSCTFRSIKEFQKDNGLKVTGKVDEKTAKKLGIL